MARTTRLRNERGLAMAEYAPLLAVIALVVFFSIAWFGPWVGNNLGTLGLSVDYGDYVAGECPAGNWEMTPLDEAPPKKNGQDVNANEDGYVCVKQIPGGGNGNTGGNQNVKDNNSQPWDGS